MPEIYQITVKLLDGKSNLLNFATPSIPILSIKDRLHEITGIPISQQRLLTGTTHLTDSSTLNPLHGSNSYPTINLLGRLLGGKGGFGSLLRGAATKAGQKKTNNFDACRDMSGRRLRHVNAEKKLEEWKAEEGERKLEKIAENFLKKKAKEVAKKVGKEGEAEKYVAKYREDSAKCMEVVEKSVREALGGSKRKGAAVSEGDSKRLKIWMGKRAVDESDSEDDDDSASDEENDKSVILNSEDQSDSQKQADGSPGSVTGQKMDGESSAGISSESGAEEGTDTKGRSSGESSPSSNAHVFMCQADDANAQEVEAPEERIVEYSSITVPQEAVASGIEACKDDKQEFNEPANLEGTLDKSITAAESDGSLGVETTVSEVSPNAEIKQGEETVAVDQAISEAAPPLNLDDFSSAADLEVLGMEKLKTELQSRGLKCGGTLQERAARLFLLKTTPLDKLPKKLLAKK